MSDKMIGASNAHHKDLILLGLQTVIYLSYMLIKKLIHNTMYIMKREELGEEEYQLEEVYLVTVVEDLGSLCHHQEVYSALLLNSQRLCLILLLEVYSVSLHQMLMRSHHLGLNHLNHYLDRIVTLDHNYYNLLPLSLKKVHANAEALISLLR